MTNFLNYLFKYSTPLHQLSEITFRELNIVLLEKKLIQILSAEVHASSMAFLLEADFVALPPESLGGETPAKSRYARLAQLLHTVPKTLVFEQIEDLALKQLFLDLGLSLILPLRVETEDIGLLVVGKKANGRPYSRPNLQFLESALPSLAITLKNADAYRRIQELSHTLETKVIERTHELEESQAAQLRLKDEFVFIATHDLATPVSAITGFVALLSKQAATLSPQSKNYLSAITEASSRLSALVKDLLEVARGDANTIKIELTRFDARETIEAAVRAITPLASQKSINPTLSLGTDNTLLADPTKLAEVLENLLSNGVKYNRVGGSLSVSSRLEGDKLVLEIKDTGIGIPESEHPKVFTKFFRSESPEARQSPGTGLGLFVARMLTEKMGGKISFTSIKDQGTTLRLEFSK